MSLEALLESLGLPKQYEFKAPNDVPITVDYVNEQYLIFSDDDYNRLKSSFRMVAESISMQTNTEVQKSPYMLLPEQVAVLSQYGYAHVRRMKTDTDYFDETAFKPSTSTDDEVDLDKARKIAMGRKAKQLKRKMNEDNASAKVLKITKQDLVGIEVTEEEIEAVVSELSVANNAKESFVNLPLNYLNDDFYETIDFFSLSLPNTKEFRRKELVFHDLWRRGFYLTTGIRFGCHYLAYEKAPGEVHARFLVECIDVEESLSPLNMITLTRVATQVKKTVLLACVAEDNHIPHYMTIQWFKPYESVSH